ncbi:D-alanyl-D-alanine carboxypeptidase/D-alanyl-D-alanine-endopeptidase [Sedimentitalea sp. HM32M-2]|uniref:D-alanyl-D-alanine carboxypeptidase/D-alanyl-D-alanine endopeptidase n=1 Tax=Sedimentitalea sp. HM32M-2 TaxID=3351566 RepID=UPI00363563C8
MDRYCTRRFVLGGLGAVIAAGAAQAGPPQVSLRPQMRGANFVRRQAGGIDALIAKSGLSGQVVCAVADVKTGLELEAAGGTTGLPPASVAKALTALYALETLGADHRFTTRLMAVGPVQNGILKGDLILAGGGDPTLNTDDLAAMAADLKKTGIREVHGDFLVYEAALPVVRSIDPEQPDHVGYSPAVSGLALNFNRVHFEWRLAGKRYAVTMDARTGRYRPDVAMARMKVVRRNLPVYTYADQQGSDQWTVASKALGKGGARWLPVRKPGAYAGDVFATMARSHGIVLKPARIAVRLPGEARTLVQHHSTPLRPILKDMLKYSNNLTAEMVGLSTTVARGKRPASLADSAAEMSRWAAGRFGMTGTRLVDHSGLGAASRMTAQDLVGALVQARKQDVLGPLLKPFGLRDAKGRVNRSHPISVNAKTGTLNFVSGLGGYMVAEDGTELAFAIFAADTRARSQLRRADRERPQGARGWNRRAKRLQQQMIERWGMLYGN